MHQIRFPRGLRAQTPLGEFTALPDPVAVFKILRSLLLRGGREKGTERGEGMEGKGEAMIGREGKERGNGMGGFAVPV